MSHPVISAYMNQGVLRVAGGCLLQTDHAGADHKAQWSTAFPNLYSLHDRMAFRTFETQGLTLERPLNTLVRPAAILLTGHIAGGPKIVYHARVSDKYGLYVKCLACWSFNWWVVAGVNARYMSAWSEKKRLRLSSAFRETILPCYIYV